MKVLRNTLAYKYYVLHVDLDNYDTCPTRGMLFLKTNKGLDPVENVEPSPLPEMIKKLPKGSNIIISFSGNQVLSRISSEVVDTLFEEIDENDFYLRKVTSENGWMIQSVCRRSIIDPIIDLVQIHKHFLLDISFSPAALPVMESQLEDETIGAGHFQFEFQQYQLIKIQELSYPVDPAGQQKTISIGGNTFTEEQLQLLALLLHYFREGPAAIGSMTESNTQSRFYRLFRQAFVVTLSSLFILLLGNFLCYSSFQRHLNALNASSENRTAQIREIERLKTQISEYEQLVSSTESSPNSTYSFFLDVIAQYRPAGIWLNSLEVHPLDKKSESNKSISPDQSHISISGEAKNPASLNAFITTLDQQEWIDDIALKNYETSPERSYADFKLEILK